MVLKYYFFSGTRDLGSGKWGLISELEAAWRTFPREMDNRRSHDHESV